MIFGSPIILSGNIRHNTNTLATHISKLNASLSVSIYPDSLKIHNALCCDPTPHHPENFWQVVQRSPSLSNLVAFLRWNLFTYHALWEWIDNPFDVLPLKPESV